MLYVVVCHIWMVMWSIHALIFRMPPTHVISLIILKPCCRDAFRDIMSHGHTSSKPCRIFWRRNATSHSTSPQSYPSHVSTLLPAFSRGVLARNFTLSYSTKSHFILGENKHFRSLTCKMKVKKIWRPYL